jgi:hypothetical protein
MPGFNSLIDIANSNILGDISLHIIPPISGLEIMLHLIPSWMNGIRGFVSLMKYLILQFLDVRHTDPSFVPQYTLIVIGAHKTLISCTNISSKCMK